MRARAGELIEAVWAAMVCLLPLAVRLVDGRLVLLVTVATFLPYLFLPSLLFGAWGLIRRRFRRHLPSLIASLVFLLLYGQQWWPGRGPTPARESDLVVMSYNVQRSWSGADAQRQLVADVSPDLLALQEVDAPPGALLGLLESSGYHCEHRGYWPSEQSPGLALCVRPPLELLSVQRRTYHPRGRWSYLFSEVAIDGRVLNVIVPHLLAFRISRFDPLREARNVFGRIREANRWHRQETQALSYIVTQLQDPTLLVGDFNSTPEQALHGHLRRHLRDSHREVGFGLGATYRYLVPLRIDYVYVTPEIEVVSSRVGSEGPSDHRPVIATLRLPDH